MKYDVNEFQLKNGGRGLIVNVPGSQVFSSQFNFRAGARFVKDYANKSETAHIMEHMAFGANDGFATSHDYDAAFTKNGAYHNAFTTDTSMNYVATCADFEWDRILTLQRSAITAPKFPEEEFAAEFGNVRSELNGYLSQADWILWPKISQNLGENTKTIQEGLDSMANIGVADIREHYARTHTAGNMRFVVAGDFSGRLTKLREILNGFELADGARKAIPVDEMHSAPAFAIRRKDVPSISMGVSMILPRHLGDAESAAMNALNHILNGTLHSRIQGAARDRGLAYYVWSKTTSYEHNSSWDFGTETSAKNLPAVMDLIVAETKRVAAGEIDESDLAEAKSFALGQHQMGIQTTGQLSHWLAGWYFFDGRIKDFSEEPERIRGVSTEEIVATARDFLAQNCWTLGLYGDTNRETAEKLHEKFAKLF